MNSNLSLCKFTNLNKGEYYGMKNYFNKSLGDERSLFPEAERLQTAQEKEKEFHTNDIINSRIAYVFHAWV